MINENVVRRAKWRNKNKWMVGLGVLSDAQEKWKLNH